jgi:hypothetical protein
MTDQEKTVEGGCRAGFWITLLDIVVTETIDCIRFVIVALVASLVIYGICLVCERSIVSYMDQVQEYAANNDIAINRDDSSN